MTIKEKIIENGVNNLKEYGYPNVNSENILTDIVYSEMFKSMLKDNKGHSNQVDKIILEIEQSINNNL